MFLASNRRRQCPSSVENHAFYGLFSTTRPPKEFGIFFVRFAYGQILALATITSSCCPRLS
jgi:hypothetical protein